MDIEFSFFFFALFCFLRKFVSTGSFQFHRFEINKEEETVDCSRETININKISKQKNEKM